MARAAFGLGAANLKLHSRGHVQNELEPDLHTRNSKVGIEVRDCGCGCRHGGQQMWHQESRTINYASLWNRKANRKAVSPKRPKVMNSVFDARAPNASHSQAKP